VFVIVTEWEPSAEGVRVVVCAAVAPEEKLRDVVPRVAVLHARVTVQAPDRGPPTGVTVTVAADPVVPEPDIPREKAVATIVLAVTYAVLVLTTLDPPAFVAINVTV
jgi:hypothetical protein